MKKFFFTLLALAATCFAGSANEATFDFSAIDFTGWTNSYAQHTVKYTEGTVEFAGASKQSSTVSDVPVTKGSNVTLTMNDGYTPITSAVLECKQWGTKKQTISVKYSTDGTTFQSWTGSPTSDNFTLNVESVPEGTVALQFSFSSTSNQVGISRLTVNYGEAGATKTTATLSFDVDRLKITWGDEFTSPVATTNSTADIEYSSSNENCATVNPATGELTLVGNGTTTITASVAANEDYTSATATYVVNVSGKPRELGEFDFVGWTFPGVYDDEGALTWSNSYAEHVVTYEEAVVTFASASKQTSTVSDCPVTKNNPVTVVLTNKSNHIASFSAEFEQWSSKTQTVIVKTSTDGENFTDTEISSATFAIASTAFDATDIVAIQFNFSKANQIGVKNIKIVEVAAAPAPAAPTLSLNGEKQVILVAAGDCSIKYYIEHPEATEAPRKEVSKSEFLDYTAGTPITMESGDLLYTYSIDSEGVESPIVCYDYSDYVATAVENIAADMAAGARYYNLQGVEVANPTQGIFIRVRGSKVDKVVVR